MIIDQAFAQTSGAGGGVSGLLQFLPMIAIVFVIFYFFLIRPQQKRMKQHQEMVGSIKRGDVVVTGGGIIAKVTKSVADSNEIEVEISPDNRIKIVRATIVEVRGKTDEKVARKPDAQKNDAAKK